MNTTITPIQNSTNSLIPPNQPVDTLNHRSNETIKPSECLVDLLERRRVVISPTLDPVRRARFGQFMTPSPVARKMVQMFGSYPQNVRLLDAGAGMGSLTAAYVEAAVAAQDRPRSIDVTAYEIDPELSSVLQSTLADCDALCREANIKFSSRIIQADYIDSAAQPRSNRRPTYNCAILNPPYKKIAASSQSQRALDMLGLKASNLYSAFVSVALTQLEIECELVAITPRSFCNGAMHKAYRSFLLASAAITALHLYGSRRSVFGDDAVVQEVVILKLRKSADQRSVALSSDTTGSRDVPVSEIVCPTDPHHFIRFPMTEDGVAQQIEALPCTLGDLGLKVSTGRVIESRVRRHLRMNPQAQSVPLVHAQNVCGDAVQWPLKGLRKSNALADHPDVQRMILPAGVYVVTKRITSKEEARRVQAGLYEGGRVAFENHLNVFHANGAGAPKALAEGLAKFLNSKEVSSYVRLFSGSTQLNATDLRTLRYPSVKHLEALGRGTLKLPDII
jgi:adenine-specific DNA-methyltransferase